MGLMRARERLKGFLTYILGRNPYEFGLVPDENGFVKIKDLLKVLSEEDGWGHIKRSSIDELVIALPDPGIEIMDPYIRAVDREKLPKPSITEALPRLVFIGIRSRAHGHVLEKGILPFEGNPYVILSSDKAMAERIAMRKDHRPVLVTVNTKDAENTGVLFLTPGDTIYLVREIPVGCFTMPPLPQIDDPAERAPKKKTDTPKKQPTPGSFFPDFSTERGGKVKSDKNDKLSWKHNKKKIRREKEKITSFHGDEFRK